LSLETLHPIPSGLFFAEMNSDWSHRTSSQFSPTGFCILVLIYIFIS